MLITKLWRTLQVLPVAIRVCYLLNSEIDIYLILDQLSRCKVKFQPRDRDVLPHDVNRALSWIGYKERACVPRALTLYALLNQGAEATYVSGVLRRNGDLDGHAWVEIESQALGEGDLSELTVIFKYPDPVARITRQS